MLYAAPFFIVGSRMTAAGVILLLYLYFYDKKSLRFNRFTLHRLFLLAFFNVYLTNVCEFWGLQYLSSAKTCLLYSISPFLSALLSFFILGEKLNVKKWIALCFGFVSFLPIIFYQSEEEISLGKLGIFSFPELAVFSAASFSVYGWILIRQLQKASQLSPLMINGYSMLLGGILTLSHSYTLEVWNPIPVYHVAGFLKSSLWMLIISNFICYNLYGFLLRKYSATFMSFAGFTTPIFSMIFATIFLAEENPWQFWLSLFAVFSSLYFFHKEEIESQFYETRKKIAVNT